MRIVFASGAVLSTDVDSVEVDRDPHSGELLRIRQEVPEDWRARLISVDVGQVAAVVLARATARSRGVPTPHPPADVNIAVERVARAQLEYDSGDEAIEWSKAAVETREHYRRRAAAGLRTLGWEIET